MAEPTYDHVPEWCRPGAPAVITDGTTDPTGMWRAVKVASVRDSVVGVTATSPYTGAHTFYGQGGGKRPQVRPSRGFMWYLAPADDPQVAAQRAARDEAKYGPGWREWVLAEDGWHPGPKHRAEDELPNTTKD